MSTISVFVACYNYGRFLSQCLDSLLAQTRIPDEILLIDDASSDDTQQVAKKYQGKVSYIRHKQNIGSSKTFHQGIKIAQGDYILALSADDWLAPTMLARETAILDKNPKVGLVYAQAYNVSGGRKKLRVAKPAGDNSYINRSNDFELLLTHGDFIPAQTALVRKTVYQKLGSWDTNLRFAQDYEMFTRIAKHYHLAYIAKPLAYYRIHEESLIRKGGWPQHLEYEYGYILKKHLKNTTPQNITIKKQAYTNYYLLVANNALIIRKPIKAFNSWLKAIITNPSILATHRSWQTIYFAAKFLAFKPK